MVAAAAAAGLVVLVACAIGGWRHHEQSKQPSSEIEIAPGVWMPLVATGMTRNYSVWLQHGGRHIDTAYLYGDDHQRAVGSAIAASGLPRSEFFITTKVNCCPTERCPGLCSTPPFHVDLPLHANATEQFEHSLRLLGVEYVDLLLVHFPCSDPQKTARVYAQLEAAHARGQARAIGVSNFNASALASLIGVVSVKPSVNQVAFSIAGHPAAHDGKNSGCQEGASLYGSDLPTLRYCESQGVTLMAYSPLGSISNVDVLWQEEVQRVAIAHNKSAAQVGLRWLVQQRIAAVTATSNAAHATELLDVFRFQLSSREMVALSELD